MKRTRLFFITAAFVALAATAGHAATLTVTNTADSGPGSLRQAILDANADTSTNDVSIEFNIPGAGVQTISPLSDRLPNVTRPVTIDGYTQPGASPNTLAGADNAVLLIELSGANPGGSYIGLLLAANGCTVRGLVVNRFTSAGIWTEQTDDNVIEGNFIGTDATGTMALGSPNGIVISGGAGNQIGGVTPGSRNVVLGNEDGIFLQGTGPGNQVLGNFAGVGPDGVSAVPNVNGVYLHYCHQVQVGGITPGARNVLSGNANGCFVNQGGSNVIRGNFIGTDVSGTLSVGSQQSGVALNESTNNVIGGTDAGAGNLISGNLDSGVVVEGLTGSNNIVAGNLIGTDVTGTRALVSGFYGVLVGPQHTIVGGANPAARNIITGSGTGVGIFGLAATNDAVLGNSIFGNGLGIVLGNFSPAVVGLTPNDSGDADDGPNHLQNFPVISSSELAGRNLKVAYSVDSDVANSTYPLSVEFFIADATGQGRTFIYRATYSTPQASDSIVFKPAASTALGDKIVATATDANGNTSEFSLPIAVTRPGQSGK